VYTAQVDRFEERTMVFRADENAIEAYEEMENYFLDPRRFEPEQRKKSLQSLRELTKYLGPVIGAYPSWHPLVNGNNDIRNPITIPNQYCGYEGLDHTRYFVNGFITCPYHSPDKVIESVENLKWKGEASIEARILDFPLYHPLTRPVLVMCNLPSEFLDGTVGLKTALSLLLTIELEGIEGSEVSETWETMKPYFLGKPHGAVSSHFINLENGRAMKKVWDCLNKTRVFGPMRHR